MTPTKRTTTILLSLFGAVLGASTIAVLAYPAEASQLLRGEYIVTQSTTVPAPAFIKFTTRKNGQTSTQYLRCNLPSGLDSHNCFIPQYNLNLPVHLLNEGPHLGRIEVDYLPLEIWADNHGFDVLGVEPNEPTVQNAEAYWHLGWETWVCSITSLDVALCNTYCGSGGGSVTVRVAGSVHNNPLHEPACEVECDCKDPDAEDSSWVDPPEVLPG